MGRGNLSSGGEHLSPVRVRGLGGVTVAVSAGTGHSCALNGAGILRCWGRNSEGQLGQGTASSPVLVAQRVRGLGARAPVAVAAGALHSCALLDNGRLRCWGWNEDGQLGNGTTTASAAPVWVDGGAFGPH
jgi:alpha-tubulin suppressor-like RCC1 family protein